MHAHDTFYKQTELRDWTVPGGAPWVESQRGGVRVPVPFGWQRRAVGTHTLLVRAPDAAMTVGMVSGGGASCFFNVLKRTVEALSQVRMLAHHTLQGAPLVGAVVEGVGVVNDSTVAWFVAKLGDAHCGVVLYGLASEHHYQRNVTLVTNMLRSIDAIPYERTAQHTLAA
jgi:hypothetical protein